MRAGSPIRVGGRCRGPRQVAREAAQGFLGVPCAWAKRVESDVHEFELRLDQKSFGIQRDDTGVATPVIAVLTDKQVQGGRVVRVQMLYQRPALRWLHG